MPERRRTTCLGCGRVNKYWLCNACHRHTSTGDRLALNEHHVLSRKPDAWWPDGETIPGFRAFIRWSWDQTASVVAHNAYQAREQAEIDQVWGKPLMGSNH